jgi:hypothetical protein
VPTNLSDVWRLKPLKFENEIAKPSARGRIDRKTNPSNHGEMNP